MQLCGEKNPETIICVTREQKLPFTKISDAHMHNFSAWGGLQVE